MGQGKTFGLILIVAGLVIGLAAGGWLSMALASGQMASGGFALGLALVAIIVLPFFAVGAVMLVRGAAEGRDMARVAQERRLLNMVLTQGRLAVADAALELNVSRDQVRAYIYDLVGKGLFTGYIRWEEGILYARDAGEMRTNKCPNCGGERELVGKGIVRCPYCGSELFL
ncbi:MAG TPA: zinc ribbon domain-containing protein [Anaerolineae bacterium]|nr:zinc ribbon domain-containing protein [Anaerolineae bacterium]HOQ97195.1 zinc ribbon domain-containing protein [Anaerolineae bacterium]HPL26421.1 zinc ribbon domain-containing protein [Anaerolineae bacterium]